MSPEHEAHNPAGEGTVIACASNTLAAPSARIEVRVDTEVSRLRPAERRSPGPLGRLTGTALKAVWQRIAPDVDAAQLRDTFMHLPGEGFIEKPERQLANPLALLKLIQTATDARHTGGETVRETMCRVVSVRAASLPLTVWIDDEYIRRVRYEDRASGGDLSVSRIRMLELWDFGVSLDALDWSRLPGSRSRSERPHT